MKRARECCADHGGTPEASGAQAHREGAAGVWRNTFIRMPYAMERLILQGVINDTFETAITWERFEKFHDVIKNATNDAIKEATGRKGEVTCRFRKPRVMGAIKMPVPTASIATETSTDRRRGCTDFSKT